jgi:hypothetical protein
MNQARTGRGGRSVVEHGIGPFVTWVATAADGGHRLQTSRRLRKRLAPIVVSAGAASPVGSDAALVRDWLRLWLPTRLGWWIAVLFMVGSALFAVGGARAAWPDLRWLGWIGAAAINPVYFAGSLFFTGAAYLQFYEALNGDITATDARRRFFGWRPRNLGYLSALVQLVGTVLFNRDTGDALLSSLGWWEQDLWVWKPDIVGCVCFLVASQLAIMEYAHGWFALRPRQLSWWIVAINMLGSILFMISGIAAFVGPTGELAAPFLANATTTWGAACFFLGAYLLIPEQAEAAS